MTQVSKEDIKSLVTRFSDKTLPKSNWNHEAHLIIGLWHHINHDFDTALAMMKSKIKGYNIAVGTLNTDDAGYHESLTIFWMIHMKNYILNNSSLDINSITNRFLRSQESQKEVSLKYYSKNVLFSKQARKSWINGDLKKIKLVDLKMNNHFDLSDEEFKNKFKDCSLEPSLFSHEAHLRFAWLHIQQQPLESAIETVNKQILNFVDNLGARDKYHKTLTVVAMKIVNHFIQKSNSDNFSDFILEFPQLKTNFKELVSVHYGFDILNSPQAKVQYLEPDLLGFN